MALGGIVGKTVMDVSGDVSGDDSGDVSGGRLSLLVWLGLLVLSKALLSS